MDIILTVIVTILTFGLLVFIHELGHFLMALRAGVYVEEFAFGFGPKVFSKKWKNVLYRINLIPLGGYVKMLGDMDGSSFTRHKSMHIDKNTKQYVLDLLKKQNLDPKKSQFNEVRDYLLGLEEELSGEDFQKIEKYIYFDLIPNHKGNFDNKSFSQRLLILVAGVFLNFVLGVFLFYVLFQFTNYSVDLSKVGDPKFIGAQISNPPILFQVYNPEKKDLERSLILAVDGSPIKNNEEFNSLLADSYNKSLKITLENASGKFDTELILRGDGLNTNFDDEVLNKVLLADINEDSAAQKAGLESGDILLELNQKLIENPDQLRAELSALKGQTVTAKIINTSAEEKIIDISLPNSKEGEPILGAVPMLNQPFLESVMRVNYSENKLMSGFYHGINVLGYNATALGEFIKQSIEEKSAEPVLSQVSSIVAIVDVTFTLVQANNFLSLLSLVAMLSIVLAFMNILPIPLFDGGHVLFLMIEKIRGKKISTETQNRIGQVVFFVLIIFTIGIMLKDVMVFDWPERFINLVKGIIN